MDCDGENTNPTVITLQAEIKSLSSEVKKLSKSLQETQNLVKTLLENGKVSDISAEVKNIKQLLDIDKKPTPNLNLNSHNPSPDLAKIGRSVHIGNIGSVINVNSNTWMYKDSHWDQIAALFGNNAGIVKIQQLRHKQYNGKLVFPVNVFYASEGHRKSALTALKSHCEANGVSMPSCQFALASYPELQHKVRLVTQTLHEAKHHGLVQSYSITNFTTIKGGTLIPLYQFKSHGIWSKTKDAASVAVFSAENAPGMADTLKTERGLYLKEAIFQHIDDTIPQYLPPPPPPKPTLKDMLPESIKSPQSKSPSKRSMNQDSQDFISNKIMRKDSQVSINTHTSSHQNQDSQDFISNKIMRKDPQVYINTHTSSHQNHTPLPPAPVAHGDYSLPHISNTSEFPPFPPPNFPTPLLNPSYCFDQGSNLNTMV